MIRKGRIVLISTIISAFIAGCQSQSEVPFPTEVTDVTEATETTEKADVTANEAETEDSGKLDEINSKLKEGSDLIYSDPNKALSIFEQLEKEGNKDAAFLEGYVCAFCVDEDNTDHEKAFSLFEAASESNPYAKICLAYEYKNGRGVEKDESRAIQLFDEAKKDINEADIDSLPYSVVAYELAGEIYKDKDISGQDYMKARDLLVKATNLGSVSAMVTLGNMYDSGEGVEQDFTISNYYYYKAIQSGSSDAMYYIGTKYRNGKGFKQDLDSSNKWYERAAELNNKESINDLGYAYQSGMGVEQDFVKAAELYERAVSLGDLPAMVNLASMYIRGQGVEKNLDKAVALCEKAADMEFPNGYNYLGHFYQEGMGVEQNYEKAVEYYEKAIEAGKKNDDFRPGHYTDLATMYENGLGVEKDQEKASELKAEAERISDEMASQQEESSESIINPEKTLSEAKEIGDDFLYACLAMFAEPGDALSIFEKEADAGNKDAEFLKAYMYYDGIWAKIRDLDKAIPLLEALSDSNPYAKICLGKCHYYGINYEKDETLGLEMMDQAFSEIDPLMVDLLPYSDVTNYMIGDYYYLGNNRDGYYSEAFEAFSKAADNNPLAMNSLGMMYYNGNGTKRDLNEAIQYLEKAANLGVSGAAEFLERINGK